MGNITQDIDNIRHAVYGREVRESIADAIEQVYEDATHTDPADTNLEVIQARNSYVNLNARENAQDAAMAAETAARASADNAEKSARIAADNTLQANINAEASSRSSQDAALQAQINQIVTPSGGAPSAAEVQNARVGADGVTYSTLGDAIRTQITDVYSTISADESIVDGLKSSNITHLTSLSSTNAALRLKNGQWIISNEGAFGTGNFIIDKYPAKPLYSYIAFGQYYANCCPMAFVDENDNILQIYGYNSSAGYSFTKTLVTGKAPIKTAYVYIMHDSANHTALGEYVPVIANDLVTARRRQGEALTPYATVTGAVAYYGTTLQIRSDGVFSGWTTSKYAVFPGEVFTIRGEYTNVQPIGCFVNETYFNNTAIWENANNTDYQVRLHEITITIPDGICEIWINRFTTHEEENSAVYPHYISGKGSLQGKTWYCIGDSITEYNTTADKKYYDFIQEETGVIPYSVAVGGRGYINGGSNDSGRFYQQIDNVPVDADIITIFGGGNDVTNFTLGNVTDTGTDTICGCINKTIDDIYTKIPLAKIGIITPNPWYSFPTSNETNKMALLANAIVKICELHGIPCLDLYHCSGMRPWETNFKNLVYTLSNNDGVHPNNIGHKMMASHIRSFIESILA